LTIRSIAYDYDQDATTNLLSVVAQETVHDN
jgi:hypothetical protein